MHSGLNFGELWLEWAIVRRFNVFDSYREVGTLDILLTKQALLALSKESPYNAGQVE